VRGATVRQRIRSRGNAITQDPPILKAQAPMRYTEPKARSAELLRLALAQMGQHAAAFNPTTFTLWYEHVGGINPRLSAALQALIQAPTPIDDAAVHTLHEAHVLPPDDEAVSRIGQEMQRVISSMAQSASQTGQRAGSYGEQLHGLSQALAGQSAGQSDDRLSPQLQQVLAGTADMQRALDALQHQVASSQSEIERLRDDLLRARDEALLDALTGVLNRKGFDRQLDRLLTETPARGGSPCLVMLDIDHFKRVNDTHGHLVGDRVIQAVGEILRTALPPGGAAAARYGGEEFAILVPNATLERTAQLAEDVRLRTKAMKIRDRRTQDVVLTVTISGGVAAWHPGDDAAALVQRADSALYQSKNTGRDRVTRA
jgi:diguanylate cyclase